MGRWDEVHISKQIAMDKNLNDLTKTKIGFTIALLAVLFASSALLEDWGGNGFFILGVFIRFKYVYYLFLATTGSAAYCYGLVFFGFERRLGEFFKKTGDWLYACAFIIPLIYPALFVINWLITIFGRFVELGWLPRLLLSALLVVVVAIFLISFVVVCRKQLIIKERNALAERQRNLFEQLTDKEFTYLSRADHLFKYEHYGFAIMEFFNTVEISLKKLLVGKNIMLPHRQNITDIVKVGEEAGLIPPGLIPLVQEIRTLRNKAVHSTRAILKEEAEKVRELTKEIMDKLNVKSKILYFEPSNTRLDIAIEDKKLVVARNERCLENLKGYDIVILFLHGETGQRLDKGLREDVQREIVRFVAEGGKLIAFHDVLFSRNKILSKELCGEVKNLLKKDVEVQIEVEEKHPINDGVGTFRLVDEEWLEIIPVVESGEELIILFSTPSGQPLGWVRDYLGGEVFVFALGHHKDLIYNSNVRKIISNALGYFS